MTNKNLTIGLLITLVIAISGLFFPKVRNLVGVVAPTDITATNFTEITASTGILTPLLQLGGSTAATSVSEQVSTGSCTAATSTPFAVANPFTATSTATLQSFQGVGNATTTLLYVGTTTQASGLALANLSPTLVNAASVATTSQFFTSSGITVGPGTGYLSSGSNTFRTIVVGPSEYVSAFATTTTSGMGTNYVGNYTSCTYKIRWQN